MSGASLVPSTSADLTPGGVDSEDGVLLAFLMAHSPATRSAYRRDIRAWLTFCEETGICWQEARRVHVDAWTRLMIEVTGLAPATVARRLSAVSSLYRYAVSEEVLTRNPVVHARRPHASGDQQHTGLSREELRVLLDAAERDGARTLALVLLLGLNGLRVSEACSLRTEDVSIERGHHTLKVHRKGARTATVPLAPRTWACLSPLIAGRPSGPLLETRTGRPLDRVAVWRSLRRLATACLPEHANRLHPHDLRAAFVTLSLDAGAPLRDVQDAVGHADPRTTRRYDRSRYNLDRHPTYALATYLT